MTPRRANGSANPWNWWKARNQTQKSRCLPTWLTSSCCCVEVSSGFTPQTLWSSFLCRNALVARAKRSLIRFSVGNQIGQEIEDLVFLQCIEHAGRHVGDFREVSTPDIGLRDRQRLVDCRQRTENKQPVIF